MKKCHLIMTFENPSSSCLSALPLLMSMPPFGQVHIISLSLSSFAKGRDNETAHWSGHQVPVALCGWSHAGSQASGQVAFSQVLSRCPFLPSRPLPGHSLSPPMRLLLSCTGPGRCKLCVSSSFFLLSSAGCSHLCPWSR